MFECIQCFFSFHLLSNWITWGYRSLVMQEFTLARLTHLYWITTFSDVWYWSLRLWTDGSYSWTNFRSMGITDTASTNITVSRMSSLLLILSTFFDDNGGAGSTHKILSSCNCVLLKFCWIWWLVLVAEDSVDDYPLGKSPSLEAAGFLQQDTQMDSLLFSNCLRSFIPDKSFYLATGMDRITYVFPARISIPRYLLSWESRAGCCTLPAIGVWLPLGRSWPLFWLRETREWPNCIFFCLYRNESG